eukprot:403369287
MSLTTRDFESLRKRKVMQKNLAKSTNSSKIIQDELDEDLDLKFAIDLEKVQKYHFQVCKKLMIASIILMILQSGYAFFWASQCGCFLLGPNQVICFMHYMKILLNLINCFKYYSNIKDMQTNHPLSSLNSYITLTFYFSMLFVYHVQMKEPFFCLQVLVAYPSTDFLQCLVSFIAIKRVKQQKKLLSEKKEYKIFEEDLHNKLKDIMYLPVEYESDQQEDDDDL